jgi:hypothetical protein
MIILGIAIVTLLFDDNMLVIFTWINIILLRFLTYERLRGYPFKKSCRCVLITSLNFTIDFIHLPLMYSPYPSVVCVNHY